ncbi:MAG TPA: nucleotidyltransferase [Flavisolibacter sp.]|nr:nucleotidyltransferase [Flavisolibacter sp.]
MDIFDKELLNFWSQLNGQGVRYIMVGGIATNLHGYQRTTNDVDVWIEDTIENRRQLRTAFREYGMGDYDMMERMQFVPEWTTFHLNNGLQLDLMVGMKGLEGFSFEDCLQLASVADIHGVHVPFLHINHLIANKKAVNRPKDQLDVIYLEKIKKLLEEEQSGNNL